MGKQGFKRNDDELKKIDDKRKRENGADAIGLVVQKK